MILKSKSLNKDCYELLRFCNKQNTTIIGGASKLFNYFLINYKPEEVISYANLDISNGSLYKMLNFKEIGFTDINYWWANNKKRYHRSNFMKHKLVAEGADPNKTANEIMVDKKYFKIWGNGNLKYVWNKKGD